MTTPDQQTPIIEITSPEQDVTPGSDTVVNAEDETDTVSHPLIEPSQTLRAPDDIKTVVDKIREILNRWGEEDANWLRAKIKTQQTSAVMKHKGKNCVRNRYATFIAIKNIPVIGSPKQEPELHKLVDVKLLLTDVKEYDRSGRWRKIKL